MWAEVTHDAKMVGHFLKWWAQAYQTNLSWHLGTILYLHTDTDTCVHICKLTADYSGHSKRKTNYCLMHVKSKAECSKGSIQQSFRPSYSYPLLLRSLFCLFWVAAQKTCFIVLATYMYILLCGGVCRLAVRLIFLFKWDFVTTKTNGSIGPTAWKVMGHILDMGQWTSPTINLKA